MPIADIYRRIDGPTFQGWTITKYAKDLNHA